MRDSCENRVFRAISTAPRALDDDEISRTSGVRPRQAVNQICRQLVDSGLLRRYVGAGGKIVNELVAERAPQPAPAVTPAPEPSTASSGRVSKSDLTDPLVPDAEFASLIDGTLRRLARRGPIFHAEADFQQELAWELRSGDPLVGVRLEVAVPQPSRAGRRERVDVVLRSPGGRAAIEVKYLTSALHTERDGEVFALAGQGAHDVSYYDVGKDVVRVENCVATGSHAWAPSSC